MDIKSRRLLHRPVIGASGRDCSFLHAGTNTVISWWPRSKNQSTANRIPWQENTSLLPWLPHTSSQAIIITGYERRNLFDFFSL